MEREVALEKLNNEFINQLDLLIELLEIYLSYLDYIDFDVQKIEARPTALDAISDLSNSSVLNFNYTNTSGYLFGTSEEKLILYMAELIWIELSTESIRWSLELRTKKMMSTVI